MANLFEINERMMALLEYGVDTESGEIVETQETFNALYDAIQLDLNTKLDNTNCLGKLLDGEIEVIDKEIERLQKEKKSRENKRDWLRKRVDNFIRSQFTDDDGNIDIESLNKYKLKLPHSSISYRKSNKVEIIDESKLDEKFIKVETIKKPKKTEIKNAINNGENVDGAIIVNEVSIQIK